MAGLRFSHILLIVALSAWILAFVINLFFPFLLYSFDSAPLFVGTLASIVEIPAHYLLSILPANRQDYFSMICFLLAIACAFIAGSVYGMESESERYAHYFEAENVVTTHEESHFVDLEKGELPPYSPYRDVESSYSDEQNIHTSSAAVGQSGSGLPMGDAMTGTFYSSAGDEFEGFDQAQGLDTFIIANRADDAVISNTLVPTIYGRVQQPYIPQPSLEGLNSAFRAAASLQPCVPAPPRLAPSVPATTVDGIDALGHIQGSCPGMDPLLGARVTEGDLVYYGEPSKFVSVSIEEVSETELFSIYLGDEESYEVEDEYMVEGNSLVYSQFGVL